MSESRIKQIPGVLVTGFTGETGRSIVQELVASNRFQHIICVGRRNLDITVYPYMMNIKQRIVDFSNVSSSDFEGAKIHICCLGSTIKEAKNAEGRHKVDFDLVKQVSLQAKSNGCDHFNLISSRGANAQSLNSYLRTKGEIEEELKTMGFTKLSIYRPGLLMVDREKSRPFEKAAMLFAKPIEYLLPGRLTTVVPKMAKCVVNNCILQNYTLSFEVIEGANLTELKTEQ